MSNRMLATKYNKQDGSVIGHLTCSPGSAMANETEETGVWLGEHVDGSTHRIRVEASPLAVVARTDLPTPEQVAADELEHERDRMEAYKLSFIRVCRLVVFDGTKLSAMIDSGLSNATEEEAEDFRNITVFQRNSPEVAKYLAGEDWINMPEEQIDDLFRFAMHVEMTNDASTWDGGNGTLDVESV